MNNIFDIFRTVTRYDIQAYFEQFAEFTLSDYQKIVDYHERGVDIPAGVLTTLTGLYDDMLQITDLFSLYAVQLSTGTAEMWEVLDYFESTKVTLMTVVNTARWLRSTKNTFRNNAVSHDFILRQGQSFEQLAVEVGYADAQNDWSGIAVNNDVCEEDYSFEGGNKLKITFVNNLSYFVNAIVDSVSGERLYGMDVDRVLTFEDNDLATLTYKDNIVQQTAILIGLTKGSVPEFPQDGIMNVAGTNINALQYPQLLRQQSALFEKDDRYKSISISQFKTEAESVIVDLQVTTRLDEVLNEQLVLS